MVILLSPANSQSEIAPNSQYCEFQAEFAANSCCERIRSKFGEFKLNSLRICIPTWGSIPVMRCSLSVQAAGPRRRWSVSHRDRSGGTRPLRRFQERSHRASSAVSSWSQLSRIGIAAGSAGAARASGRAGALGCEPVPSGAHRGARGASPAGKDPGWAAPPVPGAAPGASSSPSAWWAAWGRGRRAYGACHGDLRALPCRMLEAASLSSTGAAACTACHARCSSIAPLV